MNASPPDLAASPRRHRSRQRERVLEWLRATDSHPTAAEIHRALLLEMPALSLGTLYRNLEILVAQGAVDEVPSSNGASRSDGNVAPHHHFNCESCGRILDVDCAVGVTPCLTAADDSDYAIDEAEVVYWGRCPECLAAAPVSSGD